MHRDIKPSNILLDYQVGLWSMICCHVNMVSNRATLNCRTLAMLSSSTRLCPKRCIKRILVLGHEVIRRQSCCLKFEVQYLIRQTSMPMELSFLRYYLRQWRRWMGCFPWRLTQSEQRLESHILHPWQDYPESVPSGFTSIFDRGTFVPCFENWLGWELFIAHRSCSVCTPHGGCGYETCVVFEHVHKS